MLERQYVARSPVDHCTLSKHDLKIKVSRYGLHSTCSIPPQGPPFHSSQSPFPHLLSVSHPPQPKALHDSMTPSLRGTFLSCTTSPYAALPHLPPPVTCTIHSPFPTYHTTDHPLSCPTSSPKGTLYHLPLPTHALLILPYFTPSPLQGTLFITHYHRTF